VFGAGVSASEHRRLPAADDADRAGAPRANAKFPVIDSHNHTTVNASNIDQLISEMDQLNLRCW